MAEPLWVRVPGPSGPTTVQLSPEWVGSLKKRAGHGRAADYTPVAVKAAAAQLLAGGYYPVRDGAFSQAVRRQAYELAAQS